MDLVFRTKRYKQQSCDLIVLLLLLIYECTAPPEQRRNADSRVPQPYYKR